ncbi:UTRA domain-containing protein [Rhodophyticola sp. CCM32]|uniref:UTRA domain-containing protein n=1 Tax=Rhodophyticola sp. CCM32 TaxID=2916397 RepID=UPI00107F33C9|nr:UTRA domain-containing protein [Rhodophyticola sp. CCM32]QBY01440.1 UTRA domain-containing protein [Rhodophyticola sp. CCM32]
MDVKIKSPSQGTRQETPSLHDRILNEVRENIVSGRWPPGHRIPFETAMAKEFGCSRMTVNKALTQLARSGFLERTRKSGTYVKSPQALSAALEITNIQKEVEDAGKTYTYTLLLDVVRASNSRDAERLNKSGSKKVRAVECLHLASDAPFCYEERIINIDAVPEIEHASFEDEPPGAWLLQKVPWNSAEHQISAETTPADVATQLGINPGEPCLAVERKTQNDLGNVTWAKLWYAGANHRLVATFTPSG